MKILVCLLTFVISSLVSVPVQAATASSSSLVTRSDSVAPTNRTAVKKKEVEPTAVLALATSIGAVAGGLQSLRFSVFLALEALSIVLAVVGLIRIRRSKGRLRGTTLAWMSIALGVFWLSIIALIVFL